MKDLMKLNLYELLNIKETASEAEIKKAYRKKALVCHPDKNPDDPKADEDFKQLSKAVEILTNDFTRADYDKLLRQRKSRLKLAAINRKKEKEKKAAKEREEAKKRKQYKESKEEEKKKGCLHKKDPKRMFPTWPPSFSKPSDGGVSSSTTNSRCAHSRNMHFKKEKPRRKSKKGSFPTWPPTSPKSDSEIDNDVEEGSNFNFVPIIRPATFVAPSCAEFRNLWKGSGKTFSPIIKPAKFVAPSNSKNSDGFHSTHQKGSSPILKPATFVAPSMS